MIDAPAVPKVQDVLESSRANLRFISSDHQSGRHALYWTRWRTSWPLWPTPSYNRWLNKWRRSQRQWAPWG